MKRPTGFDPPVEEAARVPKSLRKKQAVTAVQQEPPAPSQRQLERERKRAEKSEYRRFTRDRTRRRRNIVLMLGVVVLFVSAILVAVYSPLFAVRHLSITGTERIAVEEVETALSKYYGVPLPLLDQSELSEALATFELIENYAITRQLPDTLVIQLKERTPLLSQQTLEGYTLFDAAGVTIETGTERPSGYPLLFSDAIGAEAAGFAPAVSVLRAIPADLLPRVDSIRATTQDNVNFTLIDSGKQVFWGDAHNSALKATLLAQLMSNVPGGEVYDVSSTTSPSVR